MRTNMMSIDMDFRMIPSAVPLQSPSPDKKSLNMISPTISPNAVDVKKNITPMKVHKHDREGLRQNSKFMQDLDTQLKYHSHSHSNNLNRTDMDQLKQKDETIKSLRNMIDFMTNNSRNKKPNQEQQNELKNQVKILTIQNQKLVNIIEKMSKNKNMQSNPKKAEYEDKICQLLDKIKQNQKYYQEETKEIKKFNKSLNNQYRSLESQKKELQMENNKLMKILNEKNQSEKILHDKMKLSGSSDPPNDDKHLNTNKSQQRITLVKIRQQHSENLKMLKEGLVKEIQETFDTMRIALEGINSKMYSLASRLESIQKMVWSQVTRSQVERERIKISIRQQVTHQTGQIQNNFTPQRRNNSEIYIQEGPSSSHEIASRDQFTRLEEVPSQKNFERTGLIVDELNSTKAELNQLKEKYDKLQMQRSNVSSGIVEQPTSIYADYHAKVRLLQEREQEISILYEQVGRIQEQNLRLERLVTQKNKQLEHKQEQIAKLRETIQVQIKAHHSDTQKRVTTLVQNYEKQITLLKKQVESSLLNEDRIQKVDNLSEYQCLKKQLQLVEQKHDHDQKILTQALRQSEQNLDEQKQKLLLISSQNNQLKSGIQKLNYQLKQKNQQFESMRSLKKQVQNNLEYQIVEHHKLKDILKNRQYQIQKYRQILAELEQQNLLLQIVDLQISLNLEKPKEQYNYAYPHIFQQYQNQSQILRESLVKAETINIDQLSKIFKLQHLNQSLKLSLVDQQNAYKLLQKHLQSNITKMNQLRSETTQSNLNIDQIKINITNRLQQLRLKEQQRIKIVKSSKTYQE